MLKLRCCGLFNNQKFQRLVSPSLYHLKTKIDSNEIEEAFSLRKKHEREET